MENVRPSTTATPKQIVIASLISLSLASALLVTTILPAEFNIDPLGTGKMLGIAGMSEAQTVGALNLQQESFHKDRYQILLAPFESVEYKYRLEEGATMLFDWQADAELEYDMHSEQDGVDPQEYSPSFAKGVSSGTTGSYTAPFPGIHGWFWENRTSNDVLLELNASGFFSTATEFRQGFEYKREFSKQRSLPEG
ncbi:hypothetical protein F6455_10755 [Proteobacteria bacterium 005FR1]|nr:hypothetical protein [Proteobacteria bacterium 005FR1]